MSITTPEQAVDWLHSRRYSGQKSGLVNTRFLLSRLGNPEKNFHCAHIAGTNGKGSTAAMLESMLRALGYKTGLYTSPYLIRYHERVQVMGAPIPDDALIAGVNILMEICASLEKEAVFPTTFELGTALAFWYFAQRNVDYAVVEVGLGGRMDSTNVVTPAVSLIAAIGYDHMQYLGNTLAEIAHEKAGIIKPGVPVCAARQADEILDVFRKVAHENSAPFTIAEDPTPLELSARLSRFFLPDWGDCTVFLPGRHQLLNASLALSALSALAIPIDIARVKDGLQKTKWPGRLEWFGADILLDGAHNPQGARALSAYLHDHFAGQKMTLITGMMKDKQIDACANILAPHFETVICTGISEPRAASAEKIAAAYALLGVRVVTADSPMQALSLARGLTVVAGSLYLVGEIRAHLMANASPKGAC